MSEVRPPAGPTPDVYLMQAKVEMLFQAFGELKTVLKSIEETVSSIRVFDHQLKQQSQDVLRLQEEIRTLRTTVESQERSVQSALSAAERSLDTKVQESKRIAEQARDELSTRVSYAQGALAGVTLLGAVLYGIAVWWGGRYLASVDSNTHYINALKTLSAEEQLRDLMRGQGTSPHKVEVPARPRSTH